MRRSGDIVKWLVPLAIGGAIFFLPAPAGLSIAAWRLTAIFGFVVAGLVTEPVPAPVIGLIGLSTAAAFRLVGGTPAASLRWALSGFSNDVVWLIFSATMFALGYEVTGLGRRIALGLVRRLGHSTLGLGYAIALADLVLAPFMPSNTARSAGTIFPVVKGIPPLYGSTPAQNPRAIGAYLCWTAFATTSVTSAMFVTSLAPNLLATEIAGKVAGVTIGWTDWFLGALPLGLLLFALTPVVTYLVYPPAITRAPEVARWAASELATQGPISRREIIMAVLAVMALVAWITGSAVIAPALVSLVVICLMVITGVVTWQQIVANTQAWTVLIWFATLVALADGLGQVGVLTWVAEHSGAALTGFPVLVTAVLLIVIFFVIHYLFASTTAHTTAVLPAFLAVVIAVPDMPVRPVVLALVFSIGLQGVLTPYATGPAPVWFSAGYIASKDFWKLGAVTGSMFLFVLLGVELPYLLYVNAPGVAAAPLAQTRPLNVLLLVIDDTRWDSLGVAGSPVVKTPRLDRLAAEGVRFRNAYVTTSICMVSRASIFSGQYMLRHGITAFGVPITETAWASTYPAMLRRAGYWTGFVGKYGVGTARPADFDFLRSYETRHWQQDDAGQAIHVTEKNAQDALAFLRARPRDRPFALSVSFFAAHAEDAAPEQYQPQAWSEDIYRGTTLPPPRHGDAKYVDALPAFLKAPANEGRVRFGWRFDTPARYQNYLTRYFRLITEVDQVVGRLQDELRAQGVDEETLVVFIGDNGYFQGDRGLADKWYPYEESIRVPLLVRDPRLAPARRGRVLDQMALNIDVAPTVLRAAGLRPPTVMQGEDLAPLYLGARPPAWRDEFFYEHPTITSRERIPSSLAVVRRDWKYIRWPEYAVEQFFDLTRDPDELVDLRNDRASARRLDAARARLAAWQVRVR